VDHCMPDRLPSSEVRRGVDLSLCSEYAAGSAGFGGLGATLTTLHLVFEKEVATVLGLPEGAESFALLPMGYPLGKFGPVARAPVEDVVFADRWGRAWSEA
jgi:nitroreductase